MKVNIAECLRKFIARFYNLWNSINLQLNPSQFRRIYKFLFLKLPSRYDTYVYG